MRFYIACVLFGLFVTSCSSKKKSQTLFEVINHNTSGVLFKNELKESKEFNIINYMYFYNGGGVAVGDINNDGLPDIYFSSNMGSNKLYLNKGDLTFEDVTEKAGVASAEGWKTGVTFVDINGDGWLDIYVCKVGTHFNIKSSNQLFINNGNGSFSERAKDWGVDFKGYSTQSAFFDYDKDGDLDMYLLNHSVHSKGTYGPIDFRKKKAEDTGDRLFRNEGDRFTDVTESSGIYSSVLGYGLGVAVSDLNNDGWQDLYISNDFHENDYLYYNNQDGTFTEGLERSVGHTSRFSMGNDAADINNDGLNDIIVADMQAQDEVVLKSSEGTESYDIFQFKLSYGYYYQYPRNVLQINSGLQVPINTKGIKGNLFTEIGQMAGVSATDWSWATLFCDFNNDGYKDIFISNGIMRRPNNHDYLKYISGNIVQASLQKGSDDNLSIIEKMPTGAVANYFFQNDGNLKFLNKTQDWGINFPSLSNGTAYADLDNDGDQDLVINNLNEFASILRNNTSDQKHNNYIKIRLKGEKQNYFGIGAKIEVRAGGKRIFTEQSLTRGFQSSVDPVLTIGIGKAKKIDTLIVKWNSGKEEIISNVRSNTVLELNEKKSQPPLLRQSTATEVVFELFKEKALPSWKHQENNYAGFNSEVLLPYSKSSQGPRIALGDIDQDGMEDFFICGASGQAGQIFLNKANGFLSVRSKVLEEDSLYEDVDAKWLDVDDDKDLDLYVVSGGYQFDLNNPLLKDRLYLNVGRDKQGLPRFVKSNGLPDLFTNTSCIASSDIDKDGDIDLFVGGGGEPGEYGMSVPSYLLENDGKGNFSIATGKSPSVLNSFGMVTDAKFADIDGDGYEDLIVSGEWLPITIFKNEKGVLRDITKTSGLAKSSGWWNCIEVADIDDDGDLDLLAGNLGLNSIIKASLAEPATLLVKDFDGNGKSEAILSFYKEGKQYPFNTKDELSFQMVLLKKLYTTYHSFAGKTTGEIFPKEITKGAIERYAYSFATSLFINTGNGRFEQKELPADVQVSPIFSILCEDVDGDQKKDLVLGGNLYRVAPSQGRYDGSMGHFLKGNGRGSFTNIKGTESSLLVDGEVRDLKLLKTPKNRLMLIGRNNDSIQMFKLPLEPIENSSNKISHRNSIMRNR